MKFEIPRCPTCEGPASEIEEQMIATAFLKQEDDGTYSYAGGSDAHWDTQEPAEDADKRALVSCELGHQWRTKIEADA